MRVLSVKAIESKGGGRAMAERPRGHGARGGGRGGVDVLGDVSPIFQK